ncbi:MAG: hypothetical protein ACYS5W_20090 [Planctomycetota bacterium]
MSIEQVIQGHLGAETVAVGVGVAAEQEALLAFDQVEKRLDQYGLPARVCFGGGF